MLSIFSCACWPFACLLWINVYLDLLSIFWLVYLLLSCISYLYILEIKPCGSHHWHVFSQFIGCLFILSVVSLCCAKACKFDYFLFCLFLLLFLLHRVCRSLGLNHCPLDKIQVFAEHVFPRWILPFHCKSQLPYF